MLGQAESSQALIETRLRVLVVLSGVSGSTRWVSRWTRCKKGGGGMSDREIGCVRGTGLAGGWSTVIYQANDEGYEHEASPRAGVRHTPQQSCEEV